MPTHRVITCRPHFPSAWQSAHAPPQHSIKDARVFHGPGRLFHGLQLKIGSRKLKSYEDQVMDCTVRLRIPIGMYSAGSNEYTTVNFNLTCFESG